MERNNLHDMKCEDKNNTEKSKGEKYMGESGVICATPRF